MTVDADEGRRQIEAMQPKLKVGDKVRLSAGVELMTVVGVEDYGNQVVCEWRRIAGDDFSAVETKRDTFPVRSLVLANSEIE